MHDNSKNIMCYRARIHLHDELSRRHVDLAHRALDAVLAVGVTLRRSAATIVAASVQDRNVRRPEVREHVPVKRVCACKCTMKTMKKKRAR